MSPQTLLHATRPGLIALCLSCGLVQAAVPGNWLDEQRASRRLVENLPAAEVVHLNSGNYEFLALYRPAAIAEVRGAIILLHDIGGHADWPDVIQPLRSALPKAGWDTLSLQVAAVSARQVAPQAQDLTEDTAARIRSALAFVREKGRPNVVLLGHGLGASLGAQFLANDASSFKAFIGIGMDGGGAESPLSTTVSLGLIKLPLLDIYGELDLDGVKQSADARKQAAIRAPNPAYQQLIMPASDHGFTGNATALNARIISWLRAVSPASKTAP